LDNAAVKRLLLIAVLVAAAALVPIRPLMARAVEHRLVLPQWALSATKREEARQQKRELSRQATPAQNHVKRTRTSRARRAAPARRGRVSPTPPLSPKRLMDPRVIFAALKLFRVNQRAMVVCDRIAVRRGVEPPARVRFRLRVNRTGGARVRIDRPRALRPEVARCYRMLAASWTYPATGQPYSVVLSRIASRR
jgi:hypothetical protein